MEVKVKFKGGGSFVSKPPKFSADGQTIFVAWNNVIVSYNVKTAKRLREYRGLWAPVAGFDFHYVNDVEHVTACSVTGETLSWKAELGFRTLKYEPPLQEMVVESFHRCYEGSDVNDKFLMCYRPKHAGNHLCFGTMNMSNGKWDDMHLQVGTGPTYVAVSTFNAFFAVAQDRQLLYVRLNNARQVLERKLDMGKSFTCVACHPEDDCIITGDSLGRVLVWYGFSPRDPYPPPPPGVFHWHTLPVRCLTFSVSGSDFYSGGSESVLVKWHMDDFHRKEFLPRLSSTLEQITIASENTYVAVATADNTIRILDSRFETVSVVQHLILGKEYPAGIVYNHRTKSMVLNGLVGHVQFYSPHDLTLLYHLDITGQNKLTNERNCLIESTNVTKIAFDSSGAWLATVEERQSNDEFSYESRMKFWFFNAVKQTFELSTSVELPHENGTTDVLFRPSYKADDAELQCVTSGNDKKFKIWQLVKSDSIYNRRDTWTCTRVGFYRNQPCTALAFSSDGSLLGAGFGPIVTTWLPDTCELKCSLLHSTSTEELKALHFGVADQCHFVVAATAGSICVWNLLTLAMSWTVPLQVSLLVANPILPHMAVFTVQNKVFVFQPQSSEPIFVHQIDRHLENILTAALIPADSGTDRDSNWCKSSCLFFINSKQELFCFDTDDETNESADMISDAFGVGLFNSMVPKVKSSTVKKSEPVRHLTNLSSYNKQLKQLLDAPVHTMVPIRLTCGSILRSLMVERKLSEEVT